MIALVMLSAVTASIAFTVAESRLFLGLREWTKNKNSMLGSLFACSYCFGHWVSFALVAVYRPRLFAAWWPLDYFLTALVIAWFAAFQCAVLCLLMEKTGK